MRITPNQADASLGILDSYSVRAVARDRRLYLTLARVVRELRHVNDAQQQEMNMLLRAFGKKDERGQPVVPDDKMVEHGKKVYEYLNEPRDVDIPGHIPLAAFEAAGIQPTAMELAALDWLIALPGDELLFSDNGAQ